MSELNTACTVLNKFASTNLTQDEITQMGRNLDLNGDGKIDFNEFLEAFRLVDQGNS